MGKTSYTNVSVPKFSETQMHLDIEKLEAEAKFWKTQAGHLKDALSNIPRAVTEWGYCVIKDEDGQYFRLVLEKDQTP